MINWNFVKKNKNKSILREEMMARNSRIPCCYQRMKLNQANMASTPPTGVNDRYLLFAVIA